MSRNIRLTLEYDGTPYAGWQRQKGQLSVQEVVETALAQVTGEPASAVALTVAGRTDAGVHALGQVANFHTQDLREPRRLVPALNHFLPPTIRVQLAEAVPDAFDSRHRAIGKHYRYWIYEGPHASAFYLHRAWHVRRFLSLTRLQAAATALVGLHDFESFRSAHCDAAHAIRRMDKIEVSIREEMAQGKLIQIDLHAKAFCRHMCRILCGTFVEVASGQRSPADMHRILAARDRQAAGITAPPGGLTLMRVTYPAA